MWNNSEPNESVDGLQQAVLVRQLQEQHYHQYMQQLLSSQVGVEPDEGDGDGEGDPPTLANGSLHHSQPDTEEDDDDGKALCPKKLDYLKHVSVMWFLNLLSIVNPRSGKVILWLFFLAFTE